MVDLYTAKTYKDYVRKLLEGPHFGRGVRTRIADFLKIPNSQISAILNGTEEFTLEQGVKLSEFFGHSKSETHYFMLLLERDRAGTVKLKEYYTSQLQRILEKRLEVKNRVQAESLDDPIEASTTLRYFEHWYTTALHRLVRAYPTADFRSLAQMLGLDPKVVRTTLEFLESAGFITRAKGKWVDLQSRTHLGKQSIALKMHHNHWRLQALRSLDAPAAEDLHYTLVMSLDHPAYAEIRKLLLEVVATTDRTLSQCGDERVATLNIDLFELPGFQAP